MGAWGITMGESDYGLDLLSVIVEEQLKSYTVELDCGTFRAVSERFSSKTDAARLRAACVGKTAVVRTVERKERTERPPKLYDLTTLQREAKPVWLHRPTDAGLCPTAL